MDDNWDWTRLTPGFAAGAGLETVVAAMQDAGLSSELYLTKGKTPAVRMGRLAAPKGQLLWSDGESESEQPTTWAEFAQRLDAIEPKVWADVYFHAEIAKDVALRAGAGIADQAVKVYRALYPLYRMCQK